ncbi:flagellar FlbD family protein [Huintestinicola sp.]|uniref:flagellar FlbD family protein n=1 Tax=Huintestinicola sp. TaxID=2981661 RepID=UPI003D7EA33A|nr:flagellar FlbD family protein [Oscillospiraceae bacterium]
MIMLTRVNGTTLLINESFIETAEETPDTVVTMQNGHRYFVKETVDEILQKAMEFEKEKNIR